jgi:peptide deformylase
MAVRPIVELGDPRLRMHCEAVADPGSIACRELIDDLADTLADCRQATGYGRGIAAPQIGAAERVIFLNLDGATPWPLINPEIIDRSEDEILVWDGCLSYLTIFMQVARSSWVVVSYQDPAGEWRQIRADGDLSELLQHEIDHLDGILVIDRVKDPRTFCTRGEFEKRYRAASPYA